MRYECDCGAVYSNHDALTACQNSGHGAGPVVPRFRPFNSLPVTETKHTPGPWQSEGPDMFGDYNIVPPGGGLAVAAVVSNLRPAEEVAANATLVAAAAEILAALRNVKIANVYGKLYIGVITENGCASAEIPEHSRATFLAWQKAQQAVLAKAEGR